MPWVYDCFDCDWIFVALYSFLLYFRAAHRSDSYKVEQYLGGMVLIQESFLCSKAIKCVGLVHKGDVAQEEGALRAVFHC